MTPSGEPSSLSQHTLHELVERRVSVCTRPPTTWQLESEACKALQLRPAGGPDPNSPHGGAAPSCLPPKRGAQSLSPGDHQPGWGLRHCWAEKGLQGLPHWMLGRAEGVTLRRGCSDRKGCF